MNLNKHLIYLLFLVFAFTACNDFSKNKSEDSTKELTQDSNKLSEEAFWVLTTGCPGTVAAHT